MSKHTPGPLFVAQPEKWPFDIHIVNESGDVVFTERRYAYSSSHTTIVDVMDAKGFKDKRDEAMEWNARQLADAYLRAAAPDLLEALTALLERANDELVDPQDLWEITAAKEAIAKAKGESA